MTTITNQSLNSASLTNTIGVVAGFFVSGNTDYYMVGSAQNDFLVFSDLPKIINLNIS